MYIVLNINLKNQASYPIHELQIDNGKYNETSFKKLFVEKLKSVNQKIYDNKKGIFNEDVNKNQLPRGGVIVSLGSTNGLGFAPLAGAAVTAAGAHPAHRRLAVRQISQGP